MSIYPELAYDRVVSTIQGVQFCILSADEIRSRSACEVTLNQTFMGNEPVTGGLFDTRMGVVDNNRLCATCHQRNNFCPGHFGHVTMARPVFHIQFFDTVRKVLRCVCYRCSRLLVDLDGPEARAIMARKTSNQRRWDAMIKLCQKQKVRRCGGPDGCGAKQPDQYLRTDDVRVRLVWRELSAADGGVSNALQEDDPLLDTIDEEDDAEAEAEDDDGVENVMGGLQASVASVAVVPPSSSQAAPTPLQAPSTGGGPSPASTQHEVTLSAEDVLRILRRVTDADASALGLDPRFNRPEWMICSVLLVPPPAVRPSVRHDTGQRQEDDLTHMLWEVVKYNNLLRDAMLKGSPAHTVDHLVLMVQYHVAMLIDKAPVRNLHPSTDKSGRVLRSLTERLKHKDGRIRGNLLGKRVDFSARTVITPDPNLSIDELGVPLRIAMNLTFPEVVNRHNRERLQRLVLTGPDVYPGAKHVRKTAERNRTVRLRGHPDPASIVLDDGDIVERHLLDGDYVLFNRQPSLHKMSMMAHRVRVMDFNTFRLNVCVCACYNADFDGDEMNMHVPQSLQTHHELKMLAAVPLHILSPRYSKPIITIVQDVALGVFRVTQGDVRVTECQLFNLVASNPLLDPARLPLPHEYVDDGRIVDDRGVVVVTQGKKRTAEERHRDARWSGRQLLSTALPPAVTVRMSNKDRDDDGYNPDDDEILIEGGRIVSGVLSTKAFNKESRGLVHAVNNTLGPAAVTAMLNNTQKLICDFLVLAGFSVGISDMIVPDANVEAAHEHLRGAKRNVYELLQKVHQGSFENMSTKSDADYLEDKIQELLSDGVKKADKAATAGMTNGNNRVLNMINSGSKGKPLNVQQMLTCVAQQSIEQKRVPDGFDHRTLPHFTKYDDGPEARGFVEHSFIEGLAPHEFFFHSMAGRIGLIDTAVRSVTWETPIVIQEGGATRRVRIGEWIDARIEADRLKGAANKACKFFPDDRNLELLDLPEGEVTIPTADEDGNVTWGAMTAVTRHDPGERLYKVTTQGGREVTVAESQSLVVWDSAARKFLPKASPEVAIGDFLPVVAELPEPPVIVTSVDVSQFLSKADHIYGTDFHTAHRMYREAQEARWEAGKARLERGWWERHNGVDFTVPYENVQRFNNAVSGRSELENVKEGCVYPFHATRCHGSMPATLELTKENGIFIGLYLADGHTCEKSGVVGITKNDPAVRDWAQAWFEKHGMTTNLVDNRNETGTSLTLVGHSTLLARFLHRFVGRTCYHKYVPDVAFSAPREFVVGLLSGYFSGDGSINRGEISSSSASQRLSEGVAMLCTRMGAFARMSYRPQKKATGLAKNGASPMWHVHVRAQWGQRLSDVLELIEPNKDAALQLAHFASSSGMYAERNGVVKDRVVSIEILGTEDHPKLYDVTVPSTLNFVLANGLNCRDTSETGYLQRRLVKAMEDCKVQHDMTVRNANGHIVQFLYGEDGMDAIKLEYQKLPYMTTSPAAMRASYLITAADELCGHVRPDLHARLVAAEAAWRPRLEAHFLQLLEDRRAVIMHPAINGGLEIDVPIVYPVHVQRIVDNAADLSRQLGGVDGLSDLDPVEVLDAIDQLAKQLVVGIPVPGLSVSVSVSATSGGTGGTEGEGGDAGRKRDALGVQWMPVLLRAFLSPKALIVKHRINRVAFQHILKQVRQAFFAALASPGDQIGILAACSIGEPTTQLSVHAGSWARVRTYLAGSKEPVMYSGEVGPLLDAILARHASHMVDLGAGSVVMDMVSETTGAIEILGVSDTEKTSWKRVSQISRHPANGGMVRIKTQSGKSTCMTLSHSFLTRAESGVVPIKGSDLKLGDYVPIARVIPVVESPLQTIRIGETDYELTRKLGWLFGAYLADGSTSGNQISICKVIPEYQEMIGMVSWTVFGSVTRQQWKRTDGPSRFLNGFDMSKYDGCNSIFTHKELAEFLRPWGDSYTKRVPAWVYGTNLDFIRGLLGGYFDGDGNVNAQPGKCMIRSASVCEGLTDDMIVLLAYLGIFASKCRERHLKEKDRRDLLTAQIPRKHARLFRETVGFVVPKKAAALDALIALVDALDDDEITKEEIDMVPALGDALAFIGKGLELEGQSRTYRRFQNKHAIGRRTLAKYCARFDEAYHTQVREVPETHAKNVASIARVQEVIDTTPVKNIGGTPAFEKTDVIVELVHGINGALLRSIKYNRAVQDHKNGVGVKALRDLIVDATAANDALRDARTATLADVRAKMDVVHQALDADVVWDEITELEYLPDPGTMVYDFTVPGNDSFMIDTGVLVHNTLNSVEHDTELLLRVDGELHRVKIGEFVDAHVAAMGGPEPCKPRPGVPPIPHVSRRYPRLVRGGESGEGDLDETDEDDFYERVLDDDGMEIDQVIDEDANDGASSDSDLDEDDAPAPSSLSQDRDDDRYVEPRQDAAADPVGGGAISQELHFAESPPLQHFLTGSCEMRSSSSQGGASTSGSAAGAAGPEPSVGGTTNADEDAAAAEPVSGGAISQELHFAGRPQLQHFSKRKCEISCKPPEGLRHTGGLCVSTPFCEMPTQDEAPRVAAKRKGRPPNPNKPKKVPKPPSQSSFQPPSSLPPPMFGPGAAPFADPVADPIALERHDNDTTLAWIRGKDRRVEILSCDEAGQIVWSRVEAVTKHPVVNKDGSDTLLRVTLRSGREVIATKAKSFLKRVDNRIVGVEGADLRVGDYLPVSRVLPIAPEEELTHMDLSKYINKGEFIFMSEVAKALEVHARNSHRWWIKHQGTTFTLPYKRSDSFTSAFVHGRTVQAFSPDHVYPLHCIGNVTALIPERIPLDDEFGFFVGAFLADGHATTQHIIIAKADATFRARITRFADAHQIGHRLVVATNDIGTTTELRLATTVLAPFMRNTFGEVAQFKRFPAELMRANKTFLRGVVCGYFSGDGAVSPSSASASSASRPLIEAMQQILLRFDVVGRITISPPSKTIQAKFPETHDMNVLRLDPGNTARFASLFTLDVPHKQAMLETFKTRDVGFSYGRYDFVPDVRLSSGEVVSKMHRDDIYIAALADDNPDDTAIFHAIKREMVLYDEVMSITEVRSPYPYVYDLTVEGTRNFNTYQGVALRDTFHLSGAAAATTVTSGVPRMRELMGVSKNIKTPEMRIYLRRDWATSMERAKQVLSTVQTTLFRDMVRSSAVYYDPNDSDTTVEDDAELMRFYHEFSRALADPSTTGSPSGDACDATTSPWLLRFELDRMKMLDLQVTMLDVECVLLDFYSDLVSCVLSDDNADKLVCRLRLNLAAAGTSAASNDLLTEIKALEQSIMENLVIKGVEKVVKAVLAAPAMGKLKRYDAVTDAFEPDAEWSIITLGSNIMDVFCNENVDAARTTTNDVYEVYQYLGVEASRAVLIHELRLVLGDLALDHRHLSLLGDAMSNRGFLMTIDRHGINHRGELGPLAKCSFEQTDAMLIKAGIFAERDKINGVSANIMLGQIAPCGTGECEVLIDNEAYAKAARAVPLDVIVPPGGAPRGALQGQAPGQGQGPGQGQQQRPAGAAPVTMLGDDLGAATAAEGEGEGEGEDEGAADEKGEGHGAKSLLMDADDLVIT
jgi:DNA-directed RNA polymerase beta' subunit